MFGLFAGRKREKPLVLVVEDEPDIRGFIIVMLRSMNLDVLDATNGAEGLKLALKELPDLVVLDIRMPGMDGFEVCRAVKTDAEASRIPVLMVTAMDQHKDVEKALANGADGYLVKPIDNAKFKRKVAEFLKLPLIVLAALLARGSAPAAAQDFEADSARVFAEVADSARSGNLPVFGRARPETMTDAQRAALVETLPAFATERNGKPVDAINLVFVGSEAQVRAVLEAAAWVEVSSSWRQSLGDLIRGKLSRFPPFSPLYIRGREQAMNWNHLVTLESRHHFRVWRSALPEPCGRAVWPAAGIFDQRVVWDSVPDHVADPDVDKERAYIAASVRTAGMGAVVRVVPSSKIPHEWRSGRQRRFTDGGVLVVELPPVH